jgi:hypothetical protein
MTRRRIRQAAAVAAVGIVLLLAALAYREADHPVREYHGHRTGYWERLIRLDGPDAPPEAAEAMAQGLTDWNPIYRRHTAMYLALACERGIPASLVAPLVELARSDSDPLTRCYAVLAVGRSRADPALVVPTLLEMLHEADLHRDAGKTLDEYLSAGDLEEGLRAVGDERLREEGADILRRRKEREEFFREAARQARGEREGKRP